MAKENITIMLGGKGMLRPDEPEQDGIYGDVPAELAKAKHLLSMAMRELQDYCAKLNGGEKLEHDSPSDKEESY